MKLRSNKAYLRGHFPETRQVVHDGEDGHAHDVHLGAAVGAQQAGPEWATHGYVPLDGDGDSKVHRAGLRDEGQREDNGSDELVDALRVPHHGLRVFTYLRQPEHEDRRGGDDHVERRETD